MSSFFSSINGSNVLLFLPAVCTLLSTPIFLIKSEVELFSGEFWSGSKAKDLGLVDGIGDAHQVLKEKFGDNVVIKKFEKTKGWLSQKLSSSNNQVDQLANILDERSIWQRYGF